jgi:hypothetical protein
LKIKDRRDEYTHIGGRFLDRFPSVSVAEEAIGKIREAIHDIYERMSEETPAWVNFDQADGWPSKGGITGSIHLTLLKGPIDKNDPNVYKISLVTLTGEEKELI